MWRQTVLLALVAVGPAGCALVDREQLGRDVAQVVQERAGVAPAWRRGDPIAAEQVKQRLEAGIGADDAVAVALLASPDLQASFERLGLARAEFLEQATLSNPAVSWSRLRERGGPGSQVEWAVMQSISDLIALPLRRRAAQREFEAARFSAAGELLAGIAAVRAAWLDAKAAEQMAEFANERADLARLEAELMERFVRAGNEPVAELQEKKLEFADWQREAAAAAEHAVQARGKLARLMGVTDSETGWDLRGTFAPLPTEDGAPADLESAALKHRLDLQAARREVEARLASRLDARRRRVLPEMEAGFIRENDDGERRRGPELELEVPLFSAAQLAVAHDDAEAALAVHEAQALALDVRTEVRAARERLAQARAALVLARDNDVPAAESLAEFRQREFFFMLVGPFDAMHARGEALAARQRLIEAERDYWLARLALAQAAALPLQAVRDWVEENP